MKKSLIALLLISIIACKKDSVKCYWTNGNGDYRDTKPSQSEIDHEQQLCACAVTWTKYCPQ